VNCACVMIVVLASAEMVVAQDESAIAARHAVGAAALREGRYEDAARAFSDAIRDAEAAFRAPALELARELSGLGETYRHLGRRNESIACFARALRVEEQVWGAEHAELAPTVLRLAEAHHHDGDGEAAEALFLRWRSLSAQSRATGPEAECQVLRSLAEIRATSGRLDEAEHDSRSCLALKESAWGGDSLDVAWEATAIGDFLRIHGRSGGAEELYRRALAIIERAGPSLIVERAEQLDRLARIHIERENFDTAETLYRQVVALLQGFLGPNHLGTAAAMEKHARVLREIGRVDEAVELEESARAIHGRQ